METISSRCEEVISIAGTTTITEFHADLQQQHQQQQHYEPRTKATRNNWVQSGSNCIAVPQAMPTTAKTLDTTYEKENEYQCVKTRGPDITHAYHQMRCRGHAERMQIATASKPTWPTTSPSNAATLCHLIAAPACFLIGGNNDNTKDTNKSNNNANCNNKNNTYHNSPYNIFGDTRNRISMHVARNDLEVQLKCDKRIDKMLHYVKLSSSSNGNYDNNSKCNISCCRNLRSCLYMTILVLFYCNVFLCVSVNASSLASITPVATGNSFSLANHLPIATETTGEMTVLGAAAFEPFSMDDYNSTNSSHRLYRRDAANVPDDDDDSSYHDDEFDEYDALVKNKSAKGKYIGAPCNDLKCEATLLHVTCDKETLTCGCEKNYPVQLGLTKGCDKPKKLGEQCFYDVTCMYSDENSLCVQVRHNAMCQCASGFHSVSYTKPTRRVFCTQDLKDLTSDLPTLLGVSTGIAVLAGLICMVLHLFSKTKYPRHRNFGDANLPPPIMYSSDTGIPLTVQSGRPSSRSSLRSSGSIGSYGNRRSSSGGIIGGGGGSGGSKGILVSTSRTGAARSAAILLISCHISALSKDTSPRSQSRLTSGAGQSVNSRDNLNETGSTGDGSRIGMAGGDAIITGSRRPSLASVHSTSSSVRSYSTMRFEKETQQKEIRQEMKLRLARLHQQQQMCQNKPQIIIGDTLTMLSGRLDPGCGSSTSAITALSRLSMATPSPLTPNSTDELLPAVDELQEYPLKSEILPMIFSRPREPTNEVAAATLLTVREVATTSAMAMAAIKTTVNSEMPNEIGTTSNKIAAIQLAESGAYIGACNSSDEALSK